jgi:YYY domain-containing protein
MALAIVVVAALAVRLYGIDWDDGADLHPDELFIAKIVLIDRIHLDWPPDLARLADPARSGLNPRSASPLDGTFREFAYGALPLWITDSAAWALSRLTGTNWNAPDRAHLIGRALSALLGALTIVPVATIGTALAGRSVGLLAAIFAAVAPMSIQLAHFFTTDSWLAFFVALCLLASIKAADHGKPQWFALAGLTLGFALATKGSVFTLALPVAGAVIIAARVQGPTESASRDWRGVMRNAAAAAVAAIAGFGVFEPYALIRPDVYLQSLLRQAEIASGAFDVPFTRLYVGTFPLLYQLEQFMRWGYGPVAGLLALGGLFFLVSLAVRGGSIPAQILGFWTAAYGVVLLVSDSKFLRYLEPLAPVVAIAAALALWRLADRARTALPPHPAPLIPAIALTGTLLWTGAFLTVYAHENPRLTASRWVYANVPPGAALTADYWDDALPRALDPMLAPATAGLATVTLDLYADLPPPAAIDAIFAALHQTDVVIQSSSRVERAIRAAPWRYPVQGRYFDQLDNRNLGFTRVAEFARAPSIGGYAVDDHAADESFINYDHPRVVIFARDAPLPKRDFSAAMSWALQRPWIPAREPPRPTLLLPGPVGENPSTDDGRWSAAATSATPVAIAVWVVLLLILQIIGLPIARLTLGSFPDRGWGLARPLALAVAGYVVWLGASLQLLRFRAAWVILALIGTALVAGIVAKRLPRPAASPDLQARQRIWPHAEAAFWVVFLLFLAFRLITPDGWHPFWGGEKPMELALINAIERSAYFPPYDPWYADGYVNYYYYGFYLVAFLCKATGIPAEIAFNLALPTMIGLIASGAFSVAAALTRGLTRTTRWPIVGGWLAVVTATLIGNLSAIRGAIDRGRLGGDPFLAVTWSGSRAVENAITEFPFFSGLYADLHAHVIAMPLAVSTIAVSLAVATAARDRRSAPVQVARLALLALLVGSLSVTNAWDVPVYAALAVAAIFMATEWLRPVGRRLLIWGATSLLLLAGAWLAFLPFHLHFVALFSRIALVRDPTAFSQLATHFGGLILIASLGLALLALVRAARLPRNDPSLPLAIGAAVLGLTLIAAFADRRATSAGVGIFSVAIAVPPLAAVWRMQRSALTRRTRDSLIAPVALLLATVAVVTGVVAGRQALGLLAALGIAAGAGWLLLRRPSDRFLTLLLAAAFLTASGVELVVVADDLIDTPAYRMNTVFKFYNQIWVLLAISCAALIALMLATIVGRAAWHRTGAPVRWSFAARWASAGSVVAVAVLLASFTYPILATAPRLDQRFTPGTRGGDLNALAWMNEGTVPVLGSAEADAITFAGDALAIDWFFAHVAGSPVIAEASIGPYRCNGSRISAATGLPTIIGWERHQQQQRYPETLPQRVRDVRTLYTSPDLRQKEAILRRYNVEYVVVGDLERIYPVADNDCTPTGSAAAISAFADMVGTTLEIAHSGLGTTIYRVRPIGAP